MRIRGRLIAFNRGWVMTAALGASVLVGCARSGAARRESSQVAATIGALPEAAWTASTWEAASTPKQRQALRDGRAETITGEVIDVSCFLQLGKRGEAHIPCGQKCIRNGQPIGILTDQGRVYVVIAEEHHPRRDGQVSLKERFAELVAKRVQVSGMVSLYHDYRALFVRTLPTEQPAAE